MSALLAFALVSAAREAGPATGLTLAQAVVLGVVEGITEYLPVSSTAHLAMAERVLGVGRDATSRAAADSYVVVVQGGAIVAVAWLYRRRLAGLVGALGGWRPAERPLLMAVAVAAAPAGLVGLAVRGVVKERLFEPGPIAAAWLVGGVALLAWRRVGARSGGAALEGITGRQAVTVGLAQCLALWPGTSRSLVTILAGCLAGLSLPAAVELSFLVGFVTLLGATGLELATGGPAIVATLGWAGPLLGVVVAFASALASIRWLVTFLTRRDLAPFGWYRISVAAAVFALMAAGVF